LVREPDVRSDVREREIEAFAEQLLPPFDAAGDDVLVRRHPGGRLNCRAK
jgi:hypothetical protein